MHTNSSRRLLGVAVCLVACVGMATIVVGSTAIAAGPFVPGVPIAPAADIGDGVAAEVEDGPTRVIVALDPSIDTAAAIADAQADVLAQLPEGSVEDIHTYDNVPGLQLTIAEPVALEAMNDLEVVVSIDVSSGGTGTLAEVAPLVGSTASAGAGFTGEGYTVAVLDTGADSDHPDLVDDLQAADAQCFGWNGSPVGTGFCPDGTDRQSGSGAAEDGGGHGTHVAGTITSGGVVSSPGIARDATILPIKVLDNSSFAGSFYDFGQIVEALDYILSHPELGVDVVSMSLTTNAQFPGSCDNATSWTLLGSVAVDALRDAGVLTVAAAGNNGSGTTMGAPACLSNVISVGASNDSDTMATFSQSNATTDVVAPGVNVVAPVPGGGTGNASGTSMATPVVAACAVLMLESGEASTPSELETRLETSPVTVTDPTNGLSFPRVDCDVSPPPAPEGDTIGVYRPSDGSMYLRRSNTPGFADVSSVYGMATDVPVAGDWDGDGDDTIGVFRNGTFMLRNEVTPGFADVEVSFGLPTDLPVVGDWDGDGDDTIGVYRDGQLFVRNDNAVGPPDFLVDFGIAGDLPVAGDWDGDGVDTIGVFRPSTATFHLRNTLTSGPADVSAGFGLSDDLPVVGDWDDDGIDTIGVYRDAIFYLRDTVSSGDADVVAALGVAGDVPIAGRWA